jgi:hypothetical protein
VARRPLRRPFGYLPVMPSVKDPIAHSAAAGPWLIALARAQEDTGAAPGEPIYDDERQMTFLRHPVRILAIDSDAHLSTKKADRETGEDQKGF